MGKINVLFLTNHYTVGGVQKANINMINSIDKNKFNVHVLYVRKGDLFKKLDFSNIKIQRIGSSMNYKSIFTFIYIYKVIKYIKKNKINIVHSIDSHFYIIGSIASRLCKVQHIRTQPNFILRHELTNVKYFKLLPFEKWTHLFITYQNKAKDDLIKLGVNPEKIFVKYGKPLEYDFSKSSLDIYDEFNIPKESKVIIIGHRHVPKKGFETFIEMIPYILQEYKNVIFLILGDGPKRLEFENRVKNLNISSNVIFTGFREDYLDIAHQCTFGVYPLADTAAMAWVISAGKILITQRNSSMDEYIVEGKNGFLVDQCTPEAYAKVCLNVLKNDELRLKMEQFIKENPLSKIRKYDESMNIDNIFLKVINIYNN